PPREQRESTPPAHVSQRYQTSNSRKHLKEPLCDRYPDSLRSTRAGKGNSQGLGRIDALIHSYCEEWREHFFPRHIALVYSPAGIGIELIVCGVVVVTNDDQLRTLRHLDWLS